MFSQTAAFYDAVYAFKDYARETARVHEIIRSRGRTTGNDLLDVACGTGLHMAHLQAHFRVEGLDLDEGLLAIARERLPHAPLHVGDMVEFDLGRQYDAVVCLFSSIGYVLTPDRLRAALACFARHTRPGGVVIVEPWLSPEGFLNGHLSSLFLDEPELKLARIALSQSEGNLSRFDFEYLIGTPQGVERHTERHELGLFTVEEHLAAFRDAGLEVEHDPEGLMGRGLYIGVRPEGAISEAVR